MSEELKVEWWEAPLLLFGVGLSACLVLILGSATFFVCKWLVTQ